MEGTTSSEFVEWLKFMQLDERTPTKQDYYLAQIAAEAFRPNAKNPKNVQLKDFLLDFKPVKSPEDGRPRTKKAKAARITQSKMFWKGVMSVPKDPVKHKREKRGKPR